MTGAKTIKDEKVAQLLSAQLKTNVTFVDELPTDGVDPSFMALENVKASGLETQLGFVSKDFTKVTGHEQESYVDYLDNKKAMCSKELFVFKA